MPPDMDQSGVSRQWVRHDLGPSVGGTMVPLRNVLSITAPGTFTLSPDTTLVQVNVAGAVTVVLPPAALPGVPAIALPGRYGGVPVTVTDIGGHAADFPITIQAQPAETVIGFASVQIADKFGGMTLLPSSPQHVWNVVAP
jgi:hypothetical protein